MAFSDGKSVVTRQSPLFFDVAVVAVNIKRYRLLLKGCCHHCVKRKFDQMKDHAGFFDSIRRATVVLRLTVCVCMWWWGVVLIPTYKEKAVLIKGTTAFKSRIVSEIFLKE